jgi:hypothetical protein
MERRKTKLRSRRKQKTRHPTAVVANGLLRRRQGEGGSGEVVFWEATRVHPESPRATQEAGKKYSHTPVACHKNEYHFNYVLKHEFHDVTCVTNNSYSLVKKR